ARRDGTRGTIRVLSEGGFEDGAGVVLGDRLRVVGDGGVAGGHAHDGVDVVLGHAALRQTGRQADALAETVDGASGVVDVAEGPADVAHVHDVGVEAHGVGEDQGVGETVGDAGAAAHQLGQPVVHADAAVGETA